MSTRKRTEQVQTSIWILIVFAAIGVSATSSRAQTFARTTAGEIGNDRTNTSGVTWVDYDGDNDLDLFLSNLRTNSINPVNILYRNDGGDNFTRQSAGALTTNGSIGNCWADYDNDGDIDVFTVGGSGATELYNNDGSGKFSVVTNALNTGSDLRFWACSWSDYNNDGHVDLLAVHPNGFLGPVGINNKLFRNRGDGEFEDVSSQTFGDGLAPYTVGTFYDYDLDGDSDLFIGSGPVNNKERDYLYKNLLTESGIPEFVRIEDSPIGTDVLDGQVWNWIDYDNDGDLDAYVTNYSGGSNNGMQNNLYRNDGDQILTKITTGSIVEDVGFSLSNVWGDFDNDGDLDVFVTNEFPTNKYYSNNGDGTFTSRSNNFENHLGSSAGATAGDYDNDGDLDLFVGNFGGGSSPSVNFFYRNDMHTGNDQAALNNWLKVKLKGVATNASGIGAKVRVLATINSSEVWQIREISSQNSFCGQNALDAHFGLGTASVVDSLVIHWQGGGVDSYGSQEVNSHILATEATGLTGVAVEQIGTQDFGLFLSQNYPNPASGIIDITFGLGSPGYATLSLFDAIGRRIATLFDGEVERSTVSYNVAQLPPGLYIYELKTPSQIISRKLIVAR